LHRPTTLILPEASARRLLLVQAIDTVDSTGRLLGPAERDHIERQALAATGDPARGEPLDPSSYLRERANRLLDAIRHRDPAIASIEHPRPWFAWLPWALPVAAFVAGIALDRIGNPRQVNLLSPPLLAFIFWNLAVYLLLLVGWVWRRRGGPSARPATLAHWWLAAAERRSGNLRADVAAQFRWRWMQAAGALESARWKAVLHTSAATWALGVACSIALGGVVREYRVGWESTLLDLAQVHAFLSALFAPVVALLPLEPFSMADLQRMHFGSGVDVGRNEARRWIGLYLGLLGLVVMLPRMLLALLAAAQRRHRAGHVAVNLQGEYYEQVLGRVSPVNVMLCLLPGPPQATAVLRHVLRLLSDRWPAGQPGPSTLLATARGDELHWLELAGNAQPPAQEPPRQEGWRRLLARWSPSPPPRSMAVPLQLARQRADVLLCPVAGAGDLDAVADVLRWLKRPLLVVACGPTQEAGSDAALRSVIERLGLPAEVITLEQACATWWHEQALADALARQIPAHKSAGWARVAQAWRARHEARFAQSMRLLAEELLQAARESQPAATGRMDLLRLVRPADREADASARRDASTALQERVRERHQRTSIELLHLHGVQDNAGASMPQSAHDGLLVRQGVDMPQAGMAGAASGAAMGATVDLMVGGLTLGAAAALGAVLGGGAAYVAAALKNRSNPGGSTLVEIGDDMLELMTVDALVRYLLVAHLGRQSEGAPPLAAERWKDEALEETRRARDELRVLWASARSWEEAALPVAATAQRLSAMALAVLGRLYGLRTGTASPR
jgi:hypothetical protein